MKYLLLTVLLVFSTSIYAEPYSYGKILEERYRQDNYRQQQQIEQDNYRQQQQRREASRDYEQHRQELMQQQRNKNQYSY